MSELARREETPAVPALPTPTTTDTDSWIRVVGDVARLAEHIAETAFVPKGLRGNAPATAAAILYGREVGLPPMTSLSQTHVIEGKPSMSAEAMRALILAAGHEFEIVETTGALCQMRGRRRGSQTWTAITWTIDMARAAGVTGKDNWKKYPRAMLQARCTAELARLVFPDVIHGFAAVEELDEEGEPAEEGNTPGRATVQRKTRRTSKAKPAAPEQPAPAPEAEDLPPLPDEEPQTSAAPSASAAGHTDGEEAPSPVSASSPSPSTPGDDDAGKTAPGRPSTSSGATTSDAEPGAPSQPVEPNDADPSAAASGKSSASEPPPKAATPAQLRMLFAALKQLYGGEQPEETERRYIAGRILEREVESFTKLNRLDVSKVIDTLARFRDRDHLWEFLDGLDQDALPIGEEEPVDAEIVVEEGQ